MKRPARKFYLAAAVAAVLASCAVGPTHQETISRTFPAAGLRRLELHEVNGSVDVTAGPADSVSLVAHVRARGIGPDPKKDNKGYFESNVEGDTLSVGRRTDRHFHLFMFSRDEVSVSYELKVPPQLELELRTVNGRIATRGMSGEMSVVSVNGPIDVETTGTSELSAKTVNGRVKAHFLQTFQGARLKTVNGGVTAVMPPAASFACDLSQVNGDFEASFPLNIHSHPGSRRVSGEVNGGKYDLHIVTVNGDIRIENESPALSAPAAPMAPAAPGAVPAAPPVPVKPASTGA